MQQGSGSINNGVLIGHPFVQILQVIYSGPDLGKIAGKIDVYVDSGLNKVNGVYFTISDAKLSVLKVAALETAVLGAQARLT